ncbi:MAG: terminase small subunit [Alphaproteobacteria bacterium]|nr:terminase small subunit [Alphaproteobacteria bacterium]
MGIEPKRPFKATKPTATDSGTTLPHSGLTLDRKWPIGHFGDCARWGALLTNIWVLPATIRKRGHCARALFRRRAIKNWARVFVIAAGMRSALVNKRELATRILKCSLPTIDNLLARHPDFPVEQRGDLGRSWIFDPQRVIDFLKAKRDEEEAAAIERAEFFSQFDFGLEPPEEIKGLSPAQRLAMVRAKREERRLAIETGFLADVAKLRATLEPVLRKHAIFFDTLPAKLARELNLPEELMLALRRELDAERRQFVQAIGEALAANQDAVS